MSKEAIDAVLTAENKAKEAKVKAQETARRAVAAAAEESKSRLEAARETAVGDMNDKLRLMTEAAEERLLKKRAEAVSEARAETRAAEEHMDVAAALIIEELLKYADK